jgi:hypothetical protein
MARVSEREATLNMAIQKLLEAQDMIHHYRKASDDMQIASTYLDYVLMVLYDFKKDLM